jgi:hypothetical protein
MVGWLSTDAEPVFDSIDVHADFLDFGLILEDFARGSSGISGDWIVYANDLKRFSLSSGSTKLAEGLRRGGDFELATTM